MNRAGKAAVATVATAALCAAGIGAYNVVNGLTGGNTPSTFQPNALSSTAPGADAAVKQATAFLQAWQAGPAQYTAAGQATDSPLTSAAALGSYQGGLGLTKVTFDSITAGAPLSVDVAESGGVSTSAQATPVTFKVTAAVAGGTWSYPGSLDVLQSTNGKTAVRWDPSVLYPKLKTGQKLKAGAITGDAGSVTVTDASGVPLTDPAILADASFNAVIGTIRAHESSTGGSSGTGVEVVDSTGSPVAPAAVFTAPKASTIKTTLDARLQKAAEAAVHQNVLNGMSTGVVVIDPNNGHILAIANTATDVNLAINGGQPPGSTMKIITSAALFDHSPLTPSSVLPCNATQDSSSEVFTNEKDVPANANASMTEDFARSCNTAFIFGGGRYLTQTGQPASALHDEAQQAFGFGSWSIGGGVETTDPQIPNDPSGGDRAAQYIGQGKVLVTPLAMASVAATVQNGSFHQPILLPGQAQTPASGSLSQRDDGFLRQMMHAVAYSPAGTAYPRLHDLSGVAAKTGTSEVPAGTDGWMTAYNGKIAVAAVVQGGSSGVDSAGWVVRALLQATGS